MPILVNLDIGALAWRAQFRILQYLVPFGGLCGDARLAVAAMISQALRAAADALVRSVAARALKGARFAHNITTAATVMAAAWH